MSFVPQLLAAFPEDGTTMKRPDYSAPASLSELKREYANSPEDTMLIAGGQSLLPALFKGGSIPDRLIDIGRVAELRLLEVGSDNIFLGAGLTFTEILASKAAAVLPGLVTALGYVGNCTIRNRATVGGSLAWADPRAELSLLLLTLEAVVVTERREFALADLYGEAGQNSLDPGEIIVGVRVNGFEAKKCKFLELMPRASAGRAVVGVAVCCDQFGSLRIAVSGLWKRQLCANVVGGDPAAKSLAEAWLADHHEAAATLADIAFGWAYRRRAAAVLMTRAIEAARR